MLAKKLLYLIAKLACCKTTRGGVLDLSCTLDEAEQTLPMPMHGFHLDGFLGVIDWGGINWRSWGHYRKLSTASKNSHHWLVILAVLSGSSFTL